MNKFRIALVNVFWSENDINTRYFESVSDQETYFEELTRGKFSNLVNFNMGDNIETTIVYLDTSTRDVSELVSSNYAVVQELDGEGSIINTRYFFAYPSQDSGRQMRVSLSLDDIQTNYFKFKNQISPCLIKRAHLNRWIDNGNDTVSFNCGVDSPLFEKEPFENTPKRLTKRTKINLHYSRPQDTLIDNWFKENVLGWEYVYVVQGNYNFKQMGDTDVTEYLHSLNFELKNSDDMPSDFTLKSALACLCFPIYRHFSKDIRIHDLVSDKYFRIDADGMEYFYSLNNNKSKVYARKFSFNPPWKYNNDLHPIGYVDIDTGRFIIESTTVVTRSVKALITYGATEPGRGIFYVQRQRLEQLSEIYEINKRFTFNKNEVIDVNKNPDLNPKLLSEQFFNLSIVFGGQKFDYDLQKLNKDQIQLTYTEALTPDITKAYIRVHDTDGVYIDKCEENLTGLIYSNDNSLMVDNDQLSQMLANNKNFFLQQGLNIGKALGESVAAIISGRWDKPVQTLFGIVDEGLSLDNMKNAPNQVSNANGNVYFNGLISEFAPYIEEYEMLPIEKNIINDLMFQNGFSFNKIDYISNYDNIRYYFNYIEAEVENISAPISNKEKERLKDKLKAIRFWNSDNIQYEYENYERGLLNE